MKKMYVYRIVNGKKITLGVSFMTNTRKENMLVKAMLLDVASLNGHRDNLSFIGKDADTVFFDFDKELMKMKYSSYEREGYMAILCSLQRYGQAHSCEVVMKTIS